MLVDIMVNGLVTGGMYAILAVGFALIFSIARIINIAHTAFYMIAAFLLFTGIKIFHWGLLPSYVVAIVITILLGVVCFKILFDRVKQHQETVMIISIAVAIICQEVLLLIFGGEYRGFPPLFQGVVEICGARITYQHLFAIASAGLVLLGLSLWLYKTRIGNALRAVAQDPEIANVMGINVSNIYVIVMAVSVGLAGIGGVVMGPIYTISPFMWGNPIVVVMASVVLGGMGSIGGSVIGALILGYVETLVVFLIPDGSFLGGAAALSVMVLVLLIKPEGLFGICFEEERL